MKDIIKLINNIVVQKYPPNFPVSSINPSHTQSQNFDPNKKNQTQNSSPNQNIDPNNIKKEDLTVFEHKEKKTIITNYNSSKEEFQKSHYA